MARSVYRYTLPTALVSLAAGGLLAFFGCSPTAPPAAGKVSGLVTFEGRPLSGGVVVFVPDPDRSAGGTMYTANVERDGRFVLADGKAVITPGWYAVAIAEPPSGEWGYVFPGELRRPDRSGLEREVKAGHDHHFEFLIELAR